MLRSLISPRPFFLLSLALFAILITSSPNTAQACGGFFCSASAPVDQAGENILFSIDGTHVTAYIQVQYQGDSQDFSWVLPLPTVPEFAVGTDDLFTRLRQMTDPRFEIKWDTGNCNPFENCDQMFAEMDGSSSEVNNTTTNNEGGVEVLAEGNVGPYNYKVLSAGSGSQLYNWLNENDYDQPPEAELIIERYVADEYVFVALKLQQNNSAGDIQPIVLDYDDPMLACIPMRLTSIAARPDMPIRAWVLNAARAIPMNYFHVVLNANAYDWIGCAQTSSDSDWWGGYYGGNSNCQEAYTDLVTRATDIVDGHGFVTEYAGTSSIMEGMVFRDGQYNIDRLRGLSNPTQFMEEMLNQGFASSSLTQGLIKEFIPRPADSELPEECQGDQNFYATWNLETCLPHMPADWVFDHVAFANALDERIVQPLIDAQALVTSRPYMTRLFTTMSADEMDRDPLFSFNAQLPDVSNVHKVEARPVCDGSAPNHSTSIHLTHEDGSTNIVNGEFSEYCEFIPGEGGPVPSPLAMVQILSEDGETENVNFKDEDALKLADERVGSRRPDPSQSGVVQDTTIDDSNTGTFGGGGSSATPGDSGDACSCSSVQTSSSSVPLSGAGLLAFAFGLLVLRRRKNS